MRKTRKILLVFVLALVFTSLFAVPAFAVTEDEVQQQVNAIGREGVTGNIFIWFLCAIGFLKISQKIDSFMSSLGINVGNTGGSMLAEAMIYSRPNLKSRQQVCKMLSNTQSYALVFTKA